MIVNKYNLINSIDNNTYCKFGVSKIHGIGVFAIRDIRKDTNPFIGVDENKRFIEYSEDEINELNPDIRDYVKSLFIRTEKTYPISERGLNDIGVFNYMNHSDNPNIAVSFKSSMTKLCPFLTIRDIKVGEELCWDYRTSDGDDLENQFPFLK